MKKAFTLLEVLLSMVILSILVIVSVKAYTHLKQIGEKDTIRYLALNKIDNEMSRLVYAYENINSSTFTRYNYDFGDVTPLTNTIRVNTSTITPFNLGIIRTDFFTYDIYKINPLQNSLGLFIDTQNNVNAVELKNSLDGNVNEVNEGDIVALLGFRVDRYSTSDDFADIALSLTYPYKVSFDGTKFVYTQLWKNIETLNLKTTTKTL